MARTKRKAVPVRRSIPTIPLGEQDPLLLEEKFFPFYDPLENGFVGMIAGTHSRRPKLFGHWVAILLGLFEVTFLVIEFLFLLAVALIIFRPDVTYPLFSAIFILSVLLIHYSRFYHTNLRRILLPFVRFPKDWTGDVLLVILEIGGFAATLAFEAYSGRSVHSWERYTVDGFVSSARSWELLVFAPIKEEVVFRLLIYVLMFNRFPSQLVSCCVSAVAFGAVHLANLFASRFEPSYVIFQSVFGMLLGLVLALRFSRGRSLIAPLSLHILNNFLGGFVPEGYTYSIRDPVVLFMTLWSVLSLIPFAWKDIRALWKEERTERLVAEQRRWENRKLQ